ncbi:MAG: amino acid carrier protein, partial [Gemmatimonadota bacterium]|nr:amino acid carrier protein [Gemmatimonadota bacterium]
RGLGPNWKWMAVFFAFLLGITAFLTGNGIQANTVADNLETQFSIPTWVSGLVTSGVVAAVILGGITRIGRVTSVLAPVMALVYVFGALVVIAMNMGDVGPTFALIFREAFNPSAGVAGTGVGAFLVTLMWGVRRGLFSNEAGQGSAPIAHSAAKTDEPVSEGVVALLEPFIDTIIICTMTGLLIIMTGVWSDRFETEITLSGGDLSYRAAQVDGGYEDMSPDAPIRIDAGAHAATGPSDPQISWHEVPLQMLYVDEARSQPFSGVIDPAAGMATGDDGQTYTSLHGMAVESGAPLTMAAFYYGDRCANYLFGAKAVIPYKVIFVILHFVGAVLPLSVIWDIGDVFLSIVIWPNLIALGILAPQVVEMTRDYFERKPWRNK